MNSEIRIGTGFDIHRLVQQRPLILGGVRIDHPKGLSGHSDADVLLHAISDALLGALALGDIGTYFPDDNPQYKDADSRLLLRKTVEMIRNCGWAITNVDATIVAQRPKLAPFIKQMRANIAEEIEVDTGRISVKATTSEQLGPEGKEAGISAQATVLIFKENNSTA